MTMNEANGFASKDKFNEYSGGRRRYREFDLPGIGKVLLRSITAGEFAKVDAARTRAAMAGVGKKAKPTDQVRALNDGYVELIIATVCDADKNPLFTAMDRSMLVGLDTAISDPLVTACIEHCGIDEANVEDAEKNS
jgi:hypothetical protein